MQWGWRALVYTTYKRFQFESDYIRNDLLCCGFFFEEGVGGDIIAGYHKTEGGGGGVMGKFCPPPLPT